MGVERDFTLGSECRMQYAGDVLLSCTLETCMVLLTIVTPINSIKKMKKILNINDTAAVELTYFPRSDYLRNIEIWFSIKSTGDIRRNYHPHDVYLVDYNRTTP